MPARTTLPWDGSTPLAAELAAEEPRELLRVTDVRWFDLSQTVPGNRASETLNTGAVPDETLWLIDHVAAGLINPTAALATSTSLRFSLRIFEGGMPGPYVWFDRLAAANSNVNLSTPIVLTPGQFLSTTYQQATGVADPLAADRFAAAIQYRTAVRN